MFEIFHGPTRIPRLQLGGGESTSDGPFSSLLISYYYFVFLVAEMARNGNWVIAVVRGSL